MSRFVPSGEPQKSETAAFDYYWEEFKELPINLDHMFEMLDFYRQTMQMGSRTGYTTERGDEARAQLAITTRLIEALRQLVEKKQGSLVLGDLAELPLKEQFGDPAQDE